MQCKVKDLPNSPDMRPNAWCIISIKADIVAKIVNLNLAADTTRRTRHEAIWAAVKCVQHSAGWRELYRKGLRAVRCKLVIPGIHQ